LLATLTEPEAIPTDPKGYITRPEITFLVWVYLRSFAPNSRIATLVNASTVTIIPAALLSFEQVISPDSLVYIAV
jgi:hypothetical protein